ncbi:type II toxin-antitoxin system Phd/YefM family antitoxin [uncultured Campylobacter sp.]|uniref:type II toxin-antitoxin system Phd/YefM family antitoxin n=1 Tax=uncultured Campylobacter sp. TaxID=218934 RepID=UPI00261F5F17|nr:type II toxin-antitoxin system Phd/YefM family antitoxin [uncultured Campylobacter sp.]
MTSFKKDEIFTATQVVRNFSKILSDVSSQKIQKAIIVKNNNFEAVLLSIQEYERLQKAVELLNIVYAKKRSQNGD